jgi:hypothetical protein
MLMPTHGFQPHIARASAERFYTKVVQVLSDAHVPFLIGGAFALCYHTGFARKTKDLDIFLKRGDLPHAATALANARCRFEVLFPHWLAKSREGEHFVDLVFNSGNGLCEVDDAWFEHATPGVALGLPVQICPAEETLWSKAFIMERERFDGADIAHLLHACGKRLNWPRLLARFAEHWRVLFSHLVLYGFIYPDARDQIPSRVMHELLKRFLHDQANQTGPCNGPLLSRAQYLFDLQSWGYEDVRVTDGLMSEDALALWTAAIKK